MCKYEEMEQKAVLDGTRCFGCGQSYEVMLLIPEKGNQRRFVRHYRCDCCECVFHKFDFGYIGAFMLQWVSKLAGFVCKKAIPKSTRNSWAGFFFKTANFPPGALSPNTERDVVQWFKKTRFRTVPADERIRKNTIPNPVWNVAQCDRMSTSVNHA